MVILYLCCGAFAGGNAVWQEIVVNSGTLICAEELPGVMLGKPACTSDEYANRFSEQIKEWCESDDALILAEQRLAKYKNEMTDETYICSATYLALAMTLNGSKRLTREELLGFDS